MKILAIEKNLKQVDWNKLQPVLKDEALRVYELYQCCFIREVYFNEHKNAILIMECDNKEHALEILSTLPLVESGLIAFEVMELNPYTGYRRLISENF